MQPELTAMDLWPLVARLAPAEKVRLAELAQEAARAESPDAAAWRALPPLPGEFDAEDTDPLAVDGSGWEEFYAAR